MDKPRMTVDQPLKSKLIATKRPISPKELPGQGSQMNAPSSKDIMPLINIQLQLNMGRNSKDRAS